MKTGININKMKKITAQVKKLRDEVKESSVKRSNFSKDNTPETIRMVGQICLTVGGISAALSPLVPILGPIGGAVSLLGKGVTKLFGNNKNK